MINNTSVDGTIDPFQQAARRAADARQQHRDVKLPFNRLADGTYLKTSEAVDALGISEATLYRRKAEGWFVQGVHYVTTGPFKRSSFLWNVDEIRKVQGNWSAPEAVR
jgi:hypothetical protein